MNSPAIRIIAFVLLLQAMACGTRVSFRENPDTAGSLTTLIIVRHAEKDSTGTDPPLSGTGKRRAAYLGEMLRESEISALIASPRLRTIETLAPIAASRTLPVTVIPLDKGVRAHVAELIDTVLIRYAGLTALVASHSDVIPILLRTLGVTDNITIGDDEYDNVFIVTVPLQEGKPPTMVRLMIGTR